jgi:hypothetical protein
VRYRIDGQPRRTTHCHCLHCRGASGAAFVTWVELDVSSLTFVSGSPSRYESRPGVTREFCSRCGTQLTYRNSELPDEVDVTACSLDDVSAVRPDDHVWSDRMVPWLSMDDDLPRYRKERSGG